MNCILIQAGSENAFFLPVHMNGRIYDAKLGRFLQADPFVQDPKNSQSLNRYSYVLNNPLSYTDPSGYFSLSRFVKKWWRVVAAVVVSVVTYGAATGWAAGWLTGTALAGNAVAIGAVAGAISGFVGGAILTGTLKGAFYGALSGAVLGAIGGSTKLDDVGKTLAGASAQGVISELQGGKFGHGFLSAGVGFWTGLKFGGNPSIGKFLAATIAGGTISEITGGKFENGAFTAALAYVIAASGDVTTGDKNGRPLTDEEKTHYSGRFESELLDAVRVYEGKVPWWLRKSMDAITLGNRIYFRDGVYVPGTADGVSVLGHELVHVQQFFDGMTILKYLWASRHGYWENPYEIDAYRIDWQIRNSFCTANPLAKGCGP